MLTQGEKDDKIIAVCADDPEYKHYTDFKELPPHRLSEIRRFFEDCILKNLLLNDMIWSDWFMKNIFCWMWVHFLTYCSDKKNENKEVAVNEFLPASTAVEAIQYSMSVSNIEQLICFLFLSCNLNWNRLLEE